MEAGLIFVERDEAAAAPGQRLLNDSFDDPVEVPRRIGYRQRVGLAAQTDQDTDDGLTRAEFHLSGGM